MAELIVRLHETVASYIANAEDKNLATDIGNKVLQLSRAIFKKTSHVSQTTTLQILFGAAIENVS